MLTWNYITRSIYDTINSSIKTSDKLYFLSDTKEIYRGKDPFTESIILYKSIPTSPAVGILYINDISLEGRAWNGTSWITVINGIKNYNDPDSIKSSELSYTTNEIEPVPEGIKDISFHRESNNLIIKDVDNNTTLVPLSSITMDFIYDISNNTIITMNANLIIQDQKIDIDLRDFIKTVNYISNTIIILFNNDKNPIRIPLNTLINVKDINSEYISITVTGNAFVAEAVVLENEGNMIELEDMGLYAAVVDITKSEDYDSLISATLISVSDEGNDDLINNISISTLSTNVAIDDIVTTLNGIVSTRMKKVGPGHTDEVIIADTNGDALASGSKIGLERFKDAPDNITLATEKGVTTYVEDNLIIKSNVVVAGNMAESVSGASDDKVISEKAIVDAMTWKVL